MSENRDCLECAKYTAGFCKQWKTKISDSSIAKTCNKFGVENTLNKGMQILKNKHKKQIKQRAKVKPQQENLVCFVDFSEKVIERINGKYKHPTRTEKGNGLQIQNKIYLLNGNYKMVNRSTLKITKQYLDIPEWATKELIFLYNKTISSNPSYEKNGTV